jgi:hypothetical protein
MTIYNLNEICIEGSNKFKNEMDIIQDAYNIKLNITGNATNAHYYLDPESPINGARFDIYLDYYYYSTDGYNKKITITFDEFISYYKNSFISKILSICNKESQTTYNII